MKKVFFSLLLTFVAAVAMNKAVAQVDAGAKIEFTKDVHDYGTIEQGADAAPAAERGRAVLGQRRLVVLGRQLQLADAAGPGASGADPRAL